MMNDELFFVRKMEYLLQEEEIYEYFLGVVDSINALRSSFDDNDTICLVIQYMSRYLKHKRNFDAGNLVNMCHYIARIATSHIDSTYRYMTLCNMNYNEFINSVYEIMDVNDYKLSGPTICNYFLALGIPIVSEYYDYHFERCNEKEYFELYPSQQTQIILDHFSILEMIPKRINIIPLTKPIKYDPAIIENFSFVKNIAEGSYGKIRLVHDGEKQIITKFMDKSDMSNLISEMAYFHYLNGNEHLVKYLGYIITDKNFIILMEYHEYDILTYFEKYGLGIIRDNVVNIIKDVMKGVQSIATRGFVHCDINYCNVLLDEDMKVYITDFGFLSRPINEVEHYTNGDIAPPNEKYVAGTLDMWCVGLLICQLYVGSTVIDEYKNNMKPITNHITKKYNRKIGDLVSYLCCPIEKRWSATRCILFLR